MSERRTHLEPGQPAICLLGLTYATHNLGINALTDGALRCVLRQYPNARISLLDYGTTPRTYQFHQQGHTVPIDLLNMRFSKRLWLRNHVALLIGAALIARLLGSSPLRARWLRHWPILELLTRMDLVAAASGGDSFSDLYGLRRFFYIALPQLLALIAGRPLVLLPQTIGPFHGRLARIIARTIVGRCVVVYARDRRGVLTARALCSTLPRERIRFCFDMAFAVPPPPSDRHDIYRRFLMSHQGPIVGLNISGLLYMGGYTRRNMFGLTADYPRFIEAVIATILRRHNLRLLLIPHVFGDTNPESDEVVCRLVHRRLQSQTDPERLLIPPLPYDHRQVKLLLERCEFFIGSRMHACIAALSRGIPSVGVAYSRKFSGIMESLGMPTLVVDLRTETTDSAVRMVEHAYESRFSTRAVLNAKLPEVTDRVLSLFTEIARVI